MSAADLFVNARGEPALAHALAHEIPSADSIDLLCAFVRWHGLRVLMDPLATHCRDGKPLRVITDGLHRVHGTEGARLAGGRRRASEGELRHTSPLACTPRLGFPAEDGLLHGLRWLVEPVEIGTARRRGVERAAVGSGFAGRAGEVRRDLRELLVQPRVPRTTRARPSRRRGSNAPSRHIATMRLDAPLAFLDVEPWPHQREILEKLDVERKRHHRWKNLVVAATGTGKTIVAALDYKRLRAEKTLGPGPAPAVRGAPAGDSEAEPWRVPAGAPRSATSASSMSTAMFRRRWQHVFGSVQSLSQMDLGRLQPDAFDVVIVDEFHRAGALHLQAAARAPEAEAAPRAHRHA